MSATIEKETRGFVVSYRFSVRRNANVITVRSNSSGRHFAEHARYNLLADDGAVLGSNRITDDVARFIIENFERRGDTESFDVYESDLKAGRLLPRVIPKISPESIRHRLTGAEQSFTATGAKLAWHWPILSKFKETGYGSIIRATMTLHQVCTSRCHYCSTIARNRRDSITLQEAQAFVERLDEDQAKFNRERFKKHNDAYRSLTGSDIRLRGLILSGGGQPNLWPWFADFVTWLSQRDIDLGLITNGFPKGVPEDIYTRFKWIRISITPEDASPHYIDGQFNKQYIPVTIKNNKRMTVGYSYVVGSWTDDEILKRIDDSMAENGFDYCRTLTDCNLTRNAQLQAHNALSDRLRRLGYIDERGNPSGRIFHQLKYHGTHEEAHQLWDTGQCYVQVYNVFWDTTGHELHGKSHCYACDSITVLAEKADQSQVISSQRRFNYEKWGTVTNDEVDRLYREPVKPYFDPRKICSACLFMRNNATVKDLASRDSFDRMQPDPDIQHRNFP